MKLYTSAETRKIDKLAIKAKGISSFSLMQKAAEFSLNILLQNWPQTERVFIFCGKGNNAGDGYLLAGLLKEAGIKSIIIQVPYRKNISPTAAKAFRWTKLRKVRTVRLKSFSQFSVNNKDVFVDALLGTGIKGSVKGNIMQAIKLLNKQVNKNPILSLDIPSGICSDTGNELGLAVKADVTATFIARKRGCYTSRGRGYSGIIEYSDLAINRQILNKISCSTSIIDMEKGVNKITKRRMDSHKGDYGHVLIIGGDTGYGGAAILASKAALKSGSGLVTLATKPEHLSPALSQCPELMVKAVNSGQDLEDHLKEPTLIVIGPGLGTTPWSEQLLQRTLWEAKKRNIPVVMDADALNLLTTLKFDTPLPKKLVITPHPGEASRLLNKSTKEIEIDRFRAVKELENKFSAVCVLKGSGSLVCYKKNNSQQISVCESGNPGMASGGMGDVLSGLIGSFIAQGLKLHEATETAVDMHAKVADLVALERGELGLVASDVLEGISDLLRS